MKYQTKEVKLKQADSFISMGDKFYWAPQILLLGYFFKLGDISEFDLKIFSVILIISGVFICLGIILCNSKENLTIGKIEIYNKRNTLLNMFTIISIE